jgi:hypothetical protein
MSVPKHLAEAVARLKRARSMIELAQDKPATGRLLRIHERSGPMRRMSLLLGGIGF